MFLKNVSKNKKSFRKRITRDEISVHSLTHHPDRKKRKLIFVLFVSRPSLIRTSSLLTTTEFLPLKLSLKLNFFTFTAVIR